MALHIWVSHDDVVKGWHRLLIAGAGAAAVTLVVVLVWYRSGIGSAGVLVGVVGSLTAMIGGWFAWARRTPSAAEIETVHASVREEALKRSVGALPDLVSRQGLLDLGVEPRLGLVHDPSNRTTTADLSDIASTFRSAVGRLLVVGEPASGKTVAAYRVAKLIADDNAVGRVPLVINLSAWAGQDSFDKFLCDYLCAPGAGYGVTNRKAAVAWVNWRRFALVLDGLDEVPGVWRTQLLSRLDDWVPVDMPVVLTCRTREYDDLVKNRHRGVALAMAVELQPLDDDQLDRAFTEIAGRGDESWMDLIGRWKRGQRQAVREALRRPLMLNLAVSSHLTAMRLRDAGRDGTDATRTFIIDEYIDTVLKEDSALRSWVTWIASYLTRGQRGPFGTTAADPTVFDLTQLTPKRVPLRHAAWILVPLSLIPLYMATTMPLLAVLSSPLMFVPSLRTAAPSTFRLSGRRLKPRMLAQAFLRALLAGLLATLAFTLPSLWEWRTYGYASPQEALLEALYSGVSLLGLPTVLLYGLWSLIKPRLTQASSSIDGPWRQSRRSAWSLGLLLWLSSVAILMLAVGVQVGIESVRYESPFWEYFRLGLPFALVYGSVLGFPIGALAGLANGGWFLRVQRLALRRLHRNHGLDVHALAILRRGTLARDGALPLLRAVGSGVRFIHDEVRDRLSTAQAHHEAADPSRIHSLPLGAEARR